MSTWKIVGPLRVAGHEPGETVTIDDLDGCDVNHLVEAGHLVPTKSTTKAAPATEKE